MEAVKVQYTVRPEFVDENTSNIRRVMDALRSNPVEGMKYVSFTLEDGQTFVHINISQSAKAKSALQAMPDFQAFQSALKASKPMSPPNVESMELVGAGFDI